MREFQTTMLLLALGLIFGTILVWAIQPAETYTHEEVSAIYACGRYDGQFLVTENDKFGCLINGEIYEMEYKN